MDLVAAVVADEEPLEVAQPGEDALDDPAGAAEPGAVLGLAACDLRRDPAPAELAPVLVVVIPPISGDALRPAARSADLPRTGGMRSRSGTSCATSLRLPPVTVQASGMPVASTRRWCLEPGLARSTGLGPIAVPPFSLVRGWSPLPRATTPAHRRRAAPPTGACAAAPTPPPAARRPCAGNRLSPSRSPARAVDVSTRSRCAARTRSPAAPAGPVPACGPDSGSAAAASAATAQSSATTRRRRSTAQQPSAPPNSTTDTDAVGRQGAGPFMPIRVLRPRPPRGCREGLR